MSRDLLEQVEVAARGIVARDRVAIMGGSYGGYATLAGMTLTPGKYACGVSLVGPSNIETFMPHWNVDRMSKIVGDPRTEEGRAHLRSRSPVNFAAQARGPLLIGQGANDSRVPQAQSDTIVTVMRAAGAPWCTPCTRTRDTGCCAHPTVGRSGRSRSSSAIRN